MYSQLTIRHVEGGVLSKLLAPVSSLTAAKRWLRLRYPWHRVIRLKQIEQR